MLSPDVVAFVRAALPAAPARVLEIGAGDGELAGALREGGHEVLAIDPAGTAPGVRQVALNDVDEPAASFHAAVAVVSLHHVEPLADSFRRLADLVRPGGVVVVDEFDVERFDERAAGWWLARRENGGDHRREPAEVIADLRDHIHPLCLLLETLDEWFELGQPQRVPYLHRWYLPPGLEATEARLIAAGRLPATGARVVGTRR